MVACRSTPAGPDAISFTVAELVASALKHAPIFQEAMIDVIDRGGWSCHGGLAEIDVGLDKGARGACAHAELKQSLGAIITFTSRRYTPAWPFLPIAKYAPWGKRDPLPGWAASLTDAVFVEVIESGFDLPHIHGYDVQSAVFVMDRLAMVTGQLPYGELAQKARRWFDGRNQAGAVVFDRYRWRA